MLCKEVPHAVNQPFQQKPGRAMGSYQQRHCPFPPKEIETEWNKDRLLNFWDSRIGQQRYLAVNMLYPLRTGKNDPDGDSVSSCHFHLMPRVYRNRGQGHFFLGFRRWVPSWCQGARLPPPSASRVELQQSRATGLVGLLSRHGH